MYRKQSDIQGAFVLASIGTFSSLTGSIADMFKELGYPYGEIASSTVMGLGMANIGLIAAQTISGMTHNGINSIPREGTWLLDKEERVVDVRTNVDLKNYLQSNKSPNGIALNMPITAGGGVTHEDLTAFTTDIKSWVIQEFNDAMRPGGKLNRL